ncbi:unnamed protein product [Auanema sp. JU1783]|nr:unnamed protein product [Auanema sp. JU1783]
MSATVEKGAAAFKVFRQVVSELRKVDKTFCSKSPQYKYLNDQMREHQVTQRLFSKASNEVEQVTHLYATYLSSTRRLAELEAKYKGGEKTIEESAKLVGLALPKKKFE